MGQCSRMSPERDVDVRSALAASKGNSVPQPLYRQPMDALAESIGRACGNVPEQNVTFALMPWEWACAVAAAHAEIGRVP